VHEDDGHQIGYQALPKGVPVVSSEGIQLGTVQRVLDNAREHIFDGIVVRTREGDRFVDAPEVARITERRVTLTITEHEARSLPAYGGAVRKAHSRWRRLFGG
jgi:hypothetical protein